MLRAVVLTQYQRVTDGQTDGRMDGQTDRQTDGIAVANTALVMRALLALQKNVLFQPTLSAKYAYTRSINRPIINRVQKKTPTILWTGS